MFELGTHVLLAGIGAFLRGSRVGPKSNATTIDQAAGNLNNKNGRCFEMDGKTVGRGEGKVV